MIHIQYYYNKDQQQQHHHHHQQQKQQEYIESSNKIIVHTPNATTTTTTNTTRELVTHHITSFSNQLHKIEPHHTCNSRNNSLTYSCQFQGLTQSTSSIVSDNLHTYKISSSNFSQEGAGNNSLHSSDNKSDTVFLDSSTTYTTERSSSTESDPSNLKLQFFTVISDLARKFHTIEGQVGSAVKDLDKAHSVLKNLDISEYYLEQLYSGVVHFSIT